MTNLPSVNLRVQLSDYIQGRRATPLFVQKLKDYRNWFRELHAVELTPNNSTQNFPTDISLLEAIERQRYRDEFPETIRLADNMAFFYPDLKLMLTQVFPWNSGYVTKWDNRDRVDDSMDRFWPITYADIVRYEDFHTHGMLLERLRVVEGASITSEFVYLHWNHDCLDRNNGRGVIWSDTVMGVRFVPVNRDQLTEVLVPFFVIEDGSQVTGFRKIYQLKEDLVYDHYYTNMSNMGEEIQLCLDWLFTHYQIAYRDMFCDLVPE